MKREDARKKILRIMPRARLEEMSTLDRPYHADRKTLELNALANWDNDEAEEFLEGLKNAAR